MEPKPLEKQRARDYFLMSDLSPQQISDILDINRKTFHSWMKEGQWKRAKYVEKNAPGLLCEQYLGQLGYLNEAIRNRENKFPTKEEADIMRKVSLTYKTIKGRHRPVEENIELFTDFSHELRMKDKKTVADFIEPMDEYIKKRFNECTGLDDPWETYLQEMAEDREYEEWHATQPEPGPQKKTSFDIPDNYWEQEEEDRTENCPPPTESCCVTPPSPPVERAGVRSSHGVTDGVTPTPATTPKPLPTNSIEENTNTDLPTKKMANVDNPPVIPIDSGTTIPRQ